GDWSEGSDPSTRFQIALEIRPTPSEYQSEFLDPADSAWVERDGVRTLSREDVLTHPGRKQFLHVAEHVLSGDRRIKDGIDLSSAAV
ncbi:MAG: hypothetical protein ACM3JB_05700, partial [Acidobacteriaceae bacterium]